MLLTRRRQGQRVSVDATIPRPLGVVFLSKLVCVTPSPLRSVRAALAVGALLLATAEPGAAQNPGAPVQFRAVRVAANTVTLAWQGASDTPPDGYVLEGGFAPGEAAGSLQTAGDTTTTDVTLPAGTYFIRAYAVTSGLRSAPSNEIQVAVGLPSPPSTPVDVAASALGRRVALTWRQPDDGIAVDQVWLDVSGAVVASFPVGVSGTFQIDDVPLGTYVLQLRAVNAAGTSGPSAPVTLTRQGLAARVENQPVLPAGDSGLPMRFDPSNHPRLLEFTARERLESIAAGATSEFDGALRLKDWVAAQFPKGDPNPYPPWDALVVLDWIRGGITGGFCAQYSQVMLQALAALGYQARYVEIGQRDNPYNHYLFEYWSNERQKWIVLDADFNLHFERNGVPLSALEVHEAYVSGQQHTVTVVKGAVRAGHPDPYEWPDRTMELYYYLRYHLKADHLSAPGEDPFNRFNDMVEWSDPLTVPWELSQVPSVFPKERLTSRVVTDAEVADAPLNRIWVTPGSTSDATIDLELAHNVGQIVAVEYRPIDLNGTAGPWTRHYALSLRWHVRAIDRAIEIRGVNLRGVAGPATRVVLTP